MAKNIKQRKKLIMEPGHKYRGWGWMNEYGQVFFDASQSGTSEGKMKRVKKSDNFCLYESKQYIRISVLVKKNSNKVELIREFTKAINDACMELKNYDMTDPLNLP